MSQPPPSRKPLGGEALQDARQAWRDVRYLIIDEISMVSSTTLMYTSKRLKEITGKHEVCGGLSVITDSMIYQLPPVKAPIMFHRPTADWCRLFKSKFKCDIIVMWCSLLRVTGLVCCW